MNYKAIGLCAIAALTFPFTVQGEAFVKETIGPFRVLGENIGSCGDFDILNDYTISLSIYSYLDSDGSPNRVRYKGHYTDNIYANSAQPSYWLAGAPSNTETVWVRFEEGALTSVQMVGIPFKVTVPGHGVIFIEAGRLLYDGPTGQLIFQAGKHQFRDGDFAALCAALRP